MGDPSTSFAIGTVRDGIARVDAIADTTQRAEAAVGLTAVAVAGEQDGTIETNKTSAPAPIAVRKISEQSKPAIPTTALVVGDTKCESAETIATQCLRDGELADAGLWLSRSLSTMAALSGKQTSIAPRQFYMKPSRTITLLRSVFEGQPRVLFFEAKREGHGRVWSRVTATEPGTMPKIYYSHAEEGVDYSIFYDTVSRAGMHRSKVEHYRFALLWGMYPSRKVLQTIRPLQKINHFPGSWHLGKKDKLMKCLRRSFCTFGEAYGIYPEGFVIPDDLSQWEDVCKESAAGLWIWKPAGGMCGNGIRVMTAFVPEDGQERLALGTAGVIQRYIDKPLLINGFKFDMRLYVLVLSYTPLKIYINEEGLVRLATTLYSLSPETLAVTTMHLTNYAVNKSSSNFVEPTGSESSDGIHASKLSLRELRAHFKERGLDYPLLYDRIKDLVVKTLISVEAKITRQFKAYLGDSFNTDARTPQGSNCFELYGFDVLVDELLKPWLLEVNVWPSFTASSPLDGFIKSNLCADTLTLAGIRPFRKMSIPEGASPPVKPPSVLPECHKALEQASSAEQILGLFGDDEWELVVALHEEEMRSGGFERIFPTENARRYSCYFLSGESYVNLVLRRWLEIGGVKVLDEAHLQSLVPDRLRRR
eukprot:TRINITY_DN67262_c0_g1_i1.p1 TRINITY_DN67262_c0_g1~~TRINITY_DN67262_c0_g1_i1.p1  ORF type:complete len:649 (-),score=97.22 TRINITY_DN67262_c0_g1_i1:35-1981(-)